MTTPRRDADVIVVGAGPAGAATSLLLARAGVDVLILDRAAFPRAKPCGDCLSAGADAVLSRLGVLPTVLARPHHRIREWRIVAPDGRSFDATFSGTGALAVERAVLDDTLLSAARTAGTRFEHAAVTDVIVHSGSVRGVTSRERAWHAPLVVGADGLRSVIASRLQLRAPPGRLRKASLTFHVAAEITDPARGEMHSGDGFCAGVATVASGRSNVTLVVDAQRHGRALAASPYDTAARLMETLPRLRGRIDPGSLREAGFHASGPFDRPCRSIAVPGAVLAGDAAGYYDPFTGQGVYQALASAELIAPCIVSALAAGSFDADAFRPYVRGRRRIVGGARLVQRGIEAVLSRPRLAGAAIARIARAPAFARTLLHVTGDVASPAALLSPSALYSFIRTAPENSA